MLFRKGLFDYIGVKKNIDLFEQIHAQKCCCKINCTDVTFTIDMSFLCKKRNTVVQCELTSTIQMFLDSVLIWWLFGGVVLRSGGLGYDSRS